MTRQHLVVILSIVYASHFSQMLVRLGSMPSCLSYVVRNYKNSVLLFEERSWVGESRAEHVL